MDSSQAVKRLTYADYASWDDDARYELIDGVAYLMSAPTITHQRISRRLTRQLDDFLDGKPCELFYAPFDVCLFGEGDEDDTVVQPDLLVVCDRSKLVDDRRCDGAPDLIIEILSPSSRGYDNLIKFNKYLQAGVREYWVVDPEVNTLAVHILTDRGYLSNVYGIEDTVDVHVLEGCQVRLQDVFATAE